MAKHPQCSTTAPSRMDFHPLCEKNFCQYCHDTLHHQIVEQDSRSNYAENTSQSKQRLMRNAMESPRLQNMLRTSPQTHKVTRKLQLPLYDETAPTSLMRLSAEVRLKIYRCFVYKEKWKSQYKINGWYKGGGAHGDNIGAGGDKQHRPDALFIYASYRYNASILRLSSTIHNEASDELYRHIHIRIEASLPRVHIPQLGYWLTENPTRFTRHLSFTLSFPAAQSAPLVSRLPSSSQPYRSKNLSTILQSADMITLAKTLNTMPKLARVELILCPTNFGMSRNNISTSLLVKLCLEDEEYIARLHALKNTLVEKVVLRLKVCFKDKFRWPPSSMEQFKTQEKHDMLERLKDEGFEVEEMQLGALALAPSGQISWSI